MMAQVRSEIFNTLRYSCLPGMVVTRFPDRDRAVRLRGNTQTTHTDHSYFFQTAILPSSTAIPVQPDTLSSLKSTITPSYPKPTSLMIKEQTPQLMETRTTRLNTDEIRATKTPFLSSNQPQSISQIHKSSQTSITSKFSVVHETQTIGSAFNSLNSTITPAYPKPTSLMTKVQTPQFMETRTKLNTDELRATKTQFSSSNQPLSTSQIHKSLQTTMISKFSAVHETQTIGSAFKPSKSCQVLPSASNSCAPDGSSNEQDSESILKKLVTRWWFWLVLAVLVVILLLLLCIGIRKYKKR